MGYWNQYTFSGGLNTDDLNAESSLTKAKDVIIDRNGELRKRGGKALIATLTSSTYNSLNAFLPGQGQLVSVPGSPDTMYVRDIGGSTYDSNGTTLRFDSSGTSLSSHNINLPTQPVWTASDVELFFPEPNLRTILRWGGANMSAHYNTGTLSGTAGNTYVTGSGTTWNATNTPIGAYLVYENPSNISQNIFRITSVVNNTELILDRPLPDSPSGDSYYVMPFAPVTLEGAPGSDWVNTAMSNYVIDVEGSARPAVHDDRLFVAAPSRKVGTGSVGFATTYAMERIAWSGTFGEADTDNSANVWVDYWEQNAWMDVFPGIGGDIVALVSLGRELLIVKEGATFVLRGAVQTDGTDIGAQVDIVSRSIGAANPQAVEATRAGVVIANNEGAFVYRNGRLSNITDGRVGKEWDTYAPYYSVSTSLDRVFFMNPVQSYCLVWDINLNTFTTQSHHVGCGPVTPTTDSSGTLEYESSVQGGRVSNWRSDLSPAAANKNDSGSTTTPRLDIQTKPFALNGKRPFRGRVNNVYVDAWIDDAASDDPKLSVKLLHGRGDNVTQDTSNHADVLAENTRDDVFRYPIDGAYDATHAYLNLYQASGLPAAEISLFGVGVEFEESARV